MAGQVKPWGPEVPGMGRGERGELLTRLPEGVRVAFLTRLAAGTGQLPKDPSAHTNNEGSTGSC